MSMRAQLVWDRQPPGEDDVLVNSLAFQKGLSSQADALVLAQTIVDWWEVQGVGSWRARVPSFQELREVRVYFIPNAIPDPEAVVESGAAGQGGTTALPPQAACAATLVTAERRHWGRNYWGMLAQLSVGAGGRWTTGVMEDLANAVEQLRDDVLAATAATLSVEDRATGVLRPATGVRVDDIPDVMRSRRYRSVINRETRTF